MHSSTRSRSPFRVLPLVTFLGLIASEPAWAGTAAPWEPALQLLLDWMTGTTAKVFIAVALVLALYGLAFAEGGTIWRKVGYVAFAGALIGVVVAVVDGLMGTAGAVMLVP